MPRPLSLPEAPATSGPSGHWSGGTEMRGLGCLHALTDPASPVGLCCWFSGWPP